MQIFDSTEDEILDYINWDCLSCSKKVSESTFEKYANLDPPRLIWYSVCHHANCSEAFFERHLDKIDLRVLCGTNSNISEAFIDKYIQLGKLLPYQVCQNPNISEEWLEKYILAGKLDPDCLINLWDVSEDLKRKYIKNYDKKLEEYQDEEEY